MILWELFITFCKIGFTSFGGLSMVPLINSEMLGHGWMTATEVSDIVAIAEMTPGPLGLNCAIFAVLLSSFDDNNSVGEAQILQTDFFIIFAGAWDGAP